MLKRFGSNHCPRCSGDLKVDVSSRGIDSDQRLLCSSCGFSRPMVYAVVRERDLSDHARAVDGFFADTA
jgi:transposase-like protein